MSSVTATKNSEHGSIPLARNAGTLAIEYVSQDNKYPVPCRKCGNQFSVQQDGPDAGLPFACGIMVENMEAGCMAFTCPYSKIVAGVRV